jgi:hypothetical protein
MPKKIKNMLTDLSTHMKIAFGCYLFATIIMAAFGLTYFFTTEFMSYHAAAVGMPWSKVPGPFQVLILALMKAMGGAVLAVVVLELFLLFVPFTKREKWALVAIPVGVLTVSVGALYAMVYVSLYTPATPPLWAPGIGIVIFFVGLGCSLYKPRNNQKGTL